MKSLLYLYLLALLVAGGCAFKSHAPSVEGETHWLKSCEHGSDCGENGTCICGICTTGCKQDSDCKTHDDEAVCKNSTITALSQGCCGDDLELPTHLCVLPCETNADCRVDDAELVCASELCVGPDHQLIEKQPTESCPENPDFQCTNATPSEIVTDPEYLDEDGCLLRYCENDGDCFADESCFISSHYADCYLPLWHCENTLDRDQCACSVFDYDIPVACDYGYCVKPKPVTHCTDEVDSDPIEVLDSYIEGDRLTLTVRYEGGCETHHFGMCASGNFDESDPVQGGLQLIHDASGDECRDLLTEQLYFDLTELKEIYQESYRTDSGLIDTPYGQYGFGALSCDYRYRIVEDLVQQAKSEADTSCSSDADCVFVSDYIENCFERCGAAVSNNGRIYLENRLRIIEENLCEDVEDATCVPMPNCPRIEEPLHCIDGKCS